MLLGTSVVEGKPGSSGCPTGDSGGVPPFPFIVGDGNDCTPCAIVVHGYIETSTANHSWKSRSEPKGEAVGFISLYPIGDLTETNYFNRNALKKRRRRLRQNWAVPSC